MTSTQPQTFTLSLGGSVFAPNGDKSSIDIEYLKSFEQFIRKQIAEKNRRFFIITGGGYTARQYRDAAVEAAGSDLTNEDLDWLGTHATRLNAHLLRTIFRDGAYPWILKHYDMVDKKAEDYSVVVGGGWKPGWSSDYCAVNAAVDYKAKLLLNLSNIDMVYDKDPNKFDDSKGIAKMAWRDLIGIVGTEWKPGLNSPFDPIASKIAMEKKLKVVICNGHNLDNVAKILDGEEFVGTTIE